jgi:hypothetical protein
MRTPSKGETLQHERQLGRIDQVTDRGMGRRDLDLKPGGYEQLRRGRRELMAVVVEDQRGAGRRIGKVVAAALEELIDIEHGHRTRYPRLRPQDRAGRHDHSVGRLCEDHRCVRVDPCTDVDSGGFRLLPQPLDVAMPALAAGSEPSEPSSSTQYRAALEQHDIVPSQCRPACSLLAGHASPDDHDARRFLDRGDLG